MLCKIFHWTGKMGRHHLCNNQSLSLDKGSLIKDLAALILVLASPFSLQCLGIFTDLYHEEKKSVGLCGECWVSCTVWTLVVAVVVQSLSHVLLFATPGTAARQASLSFTVSRSLLKLVYIESVMPSKHFILSSSSPPTVNLSQHQDLFQWVSSSHQVAKGLEFQLQHQSFQWIFRADLL